MKLNMGANRSATTKIDLDSLPVENVEKSRGGGGFLMGFALLWGGLPTIGLVVAIISGQFEPGLLFILLFTVIGAGLFMLGLSMFFKKKKTRFDELGVSVEQSGLFGDKSWSEPYSGYLGVLSRSEYHSGGKNSPSYTLCIVELAHAEKEKVVRLYTSRSEEGHRKIWEEYCRKLNMSAVEKDGDGYSERGVEDLDKTVAELVREGKVDLDFDTTSNIPPELQLVPEGDELLITVIKKKLSIIGALIGLSIPSVFIYVGFFVKQAPIMFGIMGILFLLAIVAGITWSLVSKQCARVSVSGIHVFSMHPWGETGGSRMRGEEIESIRVCAKEGRGAEAVWLTGDSASISVGQGLKREPLEWLKSCILKVLAS